MSQWIQVSFISLQNVSNNKCIKYKEGGAFKYHYSLGVVFTHAAFCYTWSKINKFTVKPIQLQHLTSHRSTKIALKTKHNNRSWKMTPQQKL